jgi:methylmalonyl-CoA mutase cobalamin-binding domain/chain
MTEFHLVEQISQAILIGEEVEAGDRARLALAYGADPIHILNQGLMAGAEEAGKRFERGEYYLPDLMLTGRALKAAMEVIKPALQEKYSGEVGLMRSKVVIATIQTDIHDLGKNMVASMLMAAGFDVTDLGVDVPLKSIINTAEETGARVIALSALLTTSMPYIKDLIELLEARNLRHKYLVIIGGASVTPAWAASIGADGTAGNAIEAIKLVQSLLKIK